MYAVSSSPICVQRMEFYNKIPFAFALASNDFPPIRIHPFSVAMLYMLCDGDDGDDALLVLLLQRLHSVYTN